VPLIWLRIFGTAKRWIKGFYVIDVSNPASPHRKLIVTRINAGIEMRSLLSTSRFFVASYKRRTQIIDAHGSAHLVGIGSFDAPGVLAMEKA